MREAAELEYHEKESDRAAAGGFGGGGELSGAAGARSRQPTHQPSTPHADSAATESGPLAAPCLRLTICLAPLLPADGDVSAFGAPEFIAHVPLPETAVIEAMVMDKKKRELLEKCASISTSLPRPLTLCVPCDARAESVGQRVRDSAPLVPTHCSANHSRSAAQVRFAGANSAGGRGEGNAEQEAAEGLRADAPQQRRVRQQQQRRREEEEE